MSCYREYIFTLVVILGSIGFIHGVGHRKKIEDVLKSDASNDDINRFVTWGKSAENGGIDIAELIKEDEFGTTLTRMMEALAEIQRKGDSMLVSIGKQSEVLGHLQRKADEAERRKHQAEVLSRQLEEEKKNLEAVVLELRGTKNSLELEMEEEEIEMSRVKSGLAPLLSKVSERKTELTKFENSIATKKSELRNYQNQIEKVASNLSELKNKAVTVTAPTSISSSPMLLMVLVLSIGFNLIAGAQAARTIIPQQRMDHLVSNINVAEELEGLVDIGLTELFDEEKPLKKRRRKKRKKKIAATSIDKQEKEFADSKLSKLSGNIFTSFMETKPGISLESH